MKPEEKDALARVVGVMRMFGLTFVQAKASDDPHSAYTYRLDPYVIIIIVVCCCRSDE